MSIQDQLSQFIEDRKSNAEEINPWDHLEFFIINWKKIDFNNSLYTDEEGNEFTWEIPLQLTITEHPCYIETLTKFSTETGIIHTSMEIL